MTLPPPELMAADVIARTRAFIIETFLYTRPDAVLDEQDALLEKRIVDSMGMVELVTFIQDEFGIEAADDEITEANFGSLARIGQYVTSKRNRAAA